MAKTVFSGEPLPVPPAVGNAELEAFHRKLVDYLRRLGAKISQFVEGAGQGTLMTFASYRNSDIALTTLYAGVEWNRELRKDPAYEHSNSASPEVIKLKLPGFYVVLVDLEGTDQFEIILELRPDATSIGHVIYSRSYVSINGCISASIPLPAITDAEIVVKARGLGSLLATGIRIAVIRVAVDSAGWGSSLSPDWFTSTSGSTETPYSTIENYLLMGADFGFDSDTGILEVGASSGATASFYGDVCVDDSGKGLILKSPDNHYWRVQVDNTGALTTTDLGLTKP